MTEEPTIVLLVEDHALVAEAMVELLEELGHRVLGPSPRVSHALDLLAQETPDFALVDLSLPDGSGLDLISELKTRNVPCAVLSATDAPPRLEGRLEGVRWIEKPPSRQELASLLNEYSHDRRIN